MSDPLYAGYAARTRLPAASAAVERWRAEGPAGPAELYLGPSSLLGRGRALPFGGPFPRVEVGTAGARAWVLVPGMLQSDLHDLRARLTGPAALAFAWHIAAALADLHERGLSHGSLHPSGVGVDAHGRLSIRPALAVTIPADPDREAGAVATDCYHAGALFDVLDIDRVDDAAVALLQAGLKRERARLRLQPGRAMRQALRALLARHPEAEEELAARLGPAFAAEPASTGLLRAVRPWDPAPAAPVARVAVSARVAVEAPRSAAAPAVLRAAVVRAPVSEPAPAPPVAARGAPAAAALPVAAAPAALPVAAAPAPAPSVDAPSPAALPTVRPSADPAPPVLASPPDPAEPTDARAALPTLAAQEPAEAPATAPTGAIAPVAAPAPAPAPAAPAPAAPAPAAPAPAPAAPAPAPAAASAPAAAPSPAWVDDSDDDESPAAEVPSRGQSAPRWSGAAGVTGSESREAELGAGKWAESAAAPPPVAGALGTAAPRDLDLAAGPDSRPNWAILAVVGFAVTLLAAWWALGRPEATAPAPAPEAPPAPAPDAAPPPAPR